MGMLQSCSLKENDPGGFTLESLSTSEESYKTLLNQCYFGMERYMYATDGWMELTDADTDLWTYAGNVDKSSTQYFWYFAGAEPNTTYTNSVWNGIYDGLGGCNTAIEYAKNLPSTMSEAKKNALVAQARFLRAVYYFNAVEQFGAVTMITSVQTDADYSPTRTEPMTIYREVIIPDLEYAVEWLDKGDETALATPTKKSALGFLAKACLQTYEYGTTEFLQKGMDACKKLIDDCNAGGGTYGAYMYPTFAEVFDVANNLANKEALWKYNLYADATGYGSSNGNYKLNRYDEKFLCNLTKFGARVDNYTSRMTWEGSCNGIFMPTQHLLNLFVQADGSLDPRFKASFVTQWNANKAYTWDDANATNFRKAASVAGQSIAEGELAVKFVMPQDADYATEVANKTTSKYLLIDYKDVYDDTNRKVIDTYNGSENMLHYFYPSLSKHNSIDYYVANASKNRLGNRNATFIMRMAEIYLIAAELDIYLNGGSSAMSYINKVRNRAGAASLSGTATVRTVIDERGRELCGEGTRWYDLKRVGYLDNATYLNETHPDLGQYFKSDYKLRPISTTFTATLAEGTEYQNPGYSTK